MCGAEGRRPPSSKRPTAQYAPWPRLAWGLISAVYPDSDFEAEVDKVISRLLAGPALAFAQAKNAINAAALTELEPTFARELDGQEVLLRTHDFAEGAAAFLQRRTPNFTGS